MDPVKVDVFLKETLEQIVANDQNYGVREGLVLQAMAAAHTMGLKTGIRHDPDEPEWPVVFIDHKPIEERQATYSQKEEPK